jgi:hypothetical protein
MVHAVFSHMDAAYANPGPLLPCSENDSGGSYNLLINRIIPTEGQDCRCRKKEGGRTLRGVVFALIVAKAFPVALPDEGGYGSFMTALSIKTVWWWGC